MGLLLWFVCFASALFYVYACMYCLYVCLCRCLYVILCMLVYAGCEGAGSFAGGWSSLATKHGKTHVEGKSLKRKDEYILNKSWYQIGNQNFELTNLLYISSP